LKELNSGLAKMANMSLFTLEIQVQSLAKTDNISWSVCVTYEFKSNRELNGANFTGNYIARIKLRRDIPE
jgi:hypothetical protein